MFSISRNKNNQLTIQKQQQQRQLNKHWVVLEVGKSSLSPSASTNLAFYQLQSAWHCASRSWIASLYQLGIVPASISLTFYKPLPNRHQASFNQLGIRPASTSLASGQLQPTSTSFNQLGIRPASISLASGQLQPTWNPTNFSQPGIAPA